VRVVNNASMGKIESYAYAPENKSVIAVIVPESIESVGKIDRKPLTTVVNIVMKKSVIIDFY